MSNVHELLTGNLTRLDHKKDKYIFSCEGQARSTELVATGGRMVGVGVIFGAIAAAVNATF